MTTHEAHRWVVLTALLAQDWTGKYRVKAVLRAQVYLHLVNTNQIEIRLQITADKIGKSRFGVCVYKIHVHVTPPLPKC